MVATHPHFKSIDPKVQDADTIDSLLEYAFSYENMFDRRTPPWESSQWADGELEQFQIELDQVDRLYYVKHVNDEDGEEFEMVARMNYKGRHVFVELQASCSLTGFEGQGGGFIFISNDADSFMKTVITSEFQIGRAHV